MLSNKVENGNPLNLTSSPSERVVPFIVVIALLEPEFLKSSIENGAAYEPSFVLVSVVPLPCVVASRKGSMGFWFLLEDGP